MGKSKKLRTKKKEVFVRLERRVRVTFFLPAETTEDQNAVRKVIGSLDSQFVTGNITRFTITGFTHSGIPSKISAEEMMVHETRLEKEIFFGHWWSYAEFKGVPWTPRELVVEPVVFFLIDYPVFAEEWELDQVLQCLKKDIFSIYAEQGRPQEEIWMVKQDIYRYT